MMIGFESLSSVVTGALGSFAFFLVLLAFSHEMCTFALAEITLLCFM